MPKLNRLTTVVAIVLVALSLPLWAYSAYLVTQGDLDLSVLAAAPGLALILLVPSFLPKDVRIEIWQLLVVRFVTWGFGVTLLAIAFDVPLVASLATGLVVGTVWAAFWFVGRPGEISE